ncbi:putative mitochondrial protein AtMg00810 isoform X1 [Nicotiana tabacum]|uniref:Mitochondrial protein AtMg00810 isoform X1 n=1 Tax=Nicotiana tabacum TaxID=4097 RepID=A0A1S4DHT6_TOBAC|nr:PREDICTED: uncharacterized mitochondrial protein AtMg00810-like isoform X1 [Nicotiana tabacum]
MGFVQSHYDYSLFTQRVGGDLIVILVYVDDLLVTGNNVKLIYQVRTDLQARFKMKDLGELKFFLGIDFCRSKEGILMNQRKYALELVSEMGLAGSKPVATPLEFNHKLTSVAFDEFMNKGEASTDVQLEDPGSYQKLVGRLLYLTMTRPDIAFVVQVLSQHMHAPKQSHLEAAIRVVKHIKGTAGLGMFMPAKGNKELVVYCDSDWCLCVETRKSITGYIVKFGEAVISWKSKKQSIVSRSSAESEFRNMAATVAEVTWLVGLFGELGIAVTNPVQLFYDSKAAIQIATHPIFHERTKHFDIDCHFVREKIQSGQIQTQHIGTKEQPADLLTTSLCKPQHEYLISKLGMKNLFHPLA